MKRILVGIGLSAVLIYGVDALWVELRGTRAFGTVEVRVLLDVPEKGNRVEYIPGGTETHRCVYSAFPQRGLTPCWWEERHRRREITF
jgi:hypothetical protein